MNTCIREPEICEYNFDPDINTEQWNLTDIIISSLNTTVASNYISHDMNHNMTNKPSEVPQSLYETSIFVIILILPERLIANQATTCRKNHFHTISKASRSQTSRLAL